MYRVTFLIPLLASLVFTATPVHGQAKKDTAKKEMSKLSGLVGNWMAEVTVTKDISKVVEKGDSLIYHLSIEWAADQNALSSKIVVKAGKLNVFGYAGLVGWNAAKKQIVSGGFNSKGGHKLASWELGDSETRINTMAVDGDGKKSTFTVLVTDISENSFVTQEINNQSEGEKLPDGPKVHWKRVK